MNVKSYAIVGLLLVTQALSAPQRKIITYDLANPTVEELTKIYKGAFDATTYAQKVMYKQALTHHGAPISDEAVAEKIKEALETLIAAQKTESQALKAIIQKLEADKKKQDRTIKELSKQITDQVQSLNQSTKTRIQTIAAGA